MNMTVTVPLKKGDLLVPNDGGTWERNYVEAEVRAVETIRGVDQAWVDLKGRAGGSTLHSLSVATLRAGWTRKPTFFQVGKSYTWVRVYLNPETFKVMDTYAIENPMSQGDALSAFAIVTNQYGKQYGTSLSTSDFRRMKLA